METLPRSEMENLPVSRNRVRNFRAAAKADETKRALRKNWDAFDGWCDGFGLAPFPATPEVVEAYLAHLADRGLKAASIDQARWAIDVRHKLADVALPGDSERVRVVMAGIRRTLGMRQQRKEALTIDHLRGMTFPNTLAGRRDKALLLLGFAGGFRRSELAGLAVEDLVASPDGLRIELRRSKTDQEGRGEEVTVVAGRSPAACPVAAVNAWIAAANLKRGPLFRSINRWGQIGAPLSSVAVGQIVKNAAAACGFDPARFGAHSLRAGCATYLLERGVPLNVVAKQGRWKKADTVLRYDRGATARALKGIY